MKKVQTFSSPVPTALFFVSPCQPIRVSVSPALLIKWAMFSGCLPSPLTLIIFSSPLPWCSIYLREGLQWILLSTFLAMDLFTQSNLLPEEASLMLTGHGAVLQVQQKIIRNNFIDFIFPTICVLFLPRSIATYFLVSGYPGSIGPGLYHLWRGSKVNPDIEWSLPQVLRHHCCSISCLQDRLQVKGFIAEMWLRVLSLQPS